MFDIVSKQFRTRTGGSEATRSLAQQVYNRFKSVIYTEKGRQQFSEFYIRPLVGKLSLFIIKA